MIKRNHWIAGYRDKNARISLCPLRVQMTLESAGKTLTISDQDADVAFTIPLDVVEEALAAYYAEQEGKQ